MGHRKREGVVKVNHKYSMFFIDVRNDLSPYERDKTIGHEVVHTLPFFVERIFQRGKSGLKELSNLLHFPEEILVESLGRKLRTHPHFLSELKKRYNIPISPYDLPSFEACCNIGLSMENSRDFYEKIGVMMD